MSKENGVFRFVVESDIEIEKPALFPINAELKSIATNPEAAVASYESTNGIESVRWGHPTQRDIVTRRLRATSWKSRMKHQTIGSS